MPFARTIIRAAIHPVIGITRVGISPMDYFVAQFCAVCRRSKMMATGMRRPRRDSCLGRRWAPATERGYTAPPPDLTRDKGWDTVGEPTSRFW